MKVHITFAKTYEPLTVSSTEKDPIEFRSSLNDLLTPSCFPLISSITIIIEEADLEDLGIVENYYWKYIGEILCSIKIWIPGLPKNPKITIEYE